jgi:hypothetical protein
MPRRTPGKAKSPFHGNLGVFLVLLPLTGEAKGILVVKDLFLQP